MRAKRLGVSVESKCDAVAEIKISLRFHTPLIELDMWVSRIQLSDKDGWIIAGNGLTVWDAFWHALECAE